MKKKIILSIIITILILALAGGIVAVTVINYINPPDEIVESSEELPSEHMICNDENYVEYQQKTGCGAYSAAYVLRHYGIPAHASEVHKKIGTIFGFISCRNVTDIFKDYNINAVAGCGNLYTLKYWVSKDKPVIVFTKITDDTHYIVLIGYDETYFYFADSVYENCNTAGERYNRKIAVDEFEEIWKTGGVMKDNIYIIANR